MFNNNFENQKFNILKLFMMYKLIKLFLQEKIVFKLSNLVD